VQRDPQAEQVGHAEAEALVRVEQDEQVAAVAEGEQGGDGDEAVEATRQRRHVAERGRIGDGRVSCGPGCLADPEHHDGDREQAGDEPESEHDAQRGHLVGGGRERGLAPEAVAELRVEQARGDQGPEHGAGVVHGPVEAVGQGPRRVGGAASASSASRGLVRRPLPMRSTNFTRPRAGSRSPGP
jgi:hypothetical protein